MTPYNKIDIAIDAINRRLEKVSEAAGEPEKMLALIKEIMSDPKVKEAFFEYKSKENQDEPK